MNFRRVFYIIALALAAYFLYAHNQTETVRETPAISQQEIFADFADLADNDIPKATLGGTFFTTDVFFPADFLGEAGDEFYVTMEDGHTQYTQRYIIATEVQKDLSVKLVYQPKANWEGFRPPDGKYESYQFDGEKWTQTNQ
ncbi:MAG TPA: hypothetical protein P5549_02710 [Syntrophomonas sp.]|nr:hypothetical protein [Syntrophomonas sp.]